MNEQKFPKGWNAERVQKLIAEQESMTDDELADEDDLAMSNHAGQTVISVPDALLPAIRNLIAEYTAK